MNDKSINERKQVGDWYLAAQKLGKSTEACRQAYYRKEGKAYENVRRVLIQVIKNREDFLKEDQKES